MRWPVFMLTAMLITVALFLGGCGPSSGVGQGIKHSEMQGAMNLPRGVVQELEHVKLPRGAARGIEDVGEEATGTKIKDKIKELGDRLLEEAIKEGPKAYLDYKQEFDYDVDGRFDNLDNCPYVFNGLQNDSYGGPSGDACEFDVNVDIDGDKLEDPIDNCPTVSNWSQENSDPEVDDLGDACDPDMDGDGVIDVGDTWFDSDMDGDRYDYTIDPDNDGDGVWNAYDHFDWDPAYY